MRCRITASAGTGSRVRRRCCRSPNWPCGTRTWQSERCRTRRSCVPRGWGGGVSEPPQHPSSWMSPWWPYPAWPGAMQSPHGAREEGVKSVRDKGIAEIEEEEWRRCRERGQRWRRVCGREVGWGELNNKDKRRKGRWLHYGDCILISSSKKQAQAMSSFQHVKCVFEVECWVKAGNEARHRHRHSWIVSQTTIKGQKRYKIMTERRQKKKKIKTDILFQSVTHLIIHERVWSALFVWVMVLMSKQHQTSEGVHFMNCIVCQKVVYIYILL